MLYPIPEPIEFNGDKALALSLLKQVTLDNLSVKVIIKEAQ